MNYHNKCFKPVSNSSNGELGSDMVFKYQQNENILSCTYQGGNVIIGHLLGIVDENGSIEFAYHQINQANELRTGICKSTPKILADGRIQLHELWKWTNGDQSEGESILEEISR